jgi:hypothetical protein
MGCTASVSITNNVSGAKWTKLVNSSMILSVFGMLGLQSWQATDRPEVFRLCIQVGRETVAVGAAAGLRLEPIFGFTSEQFHGSTDETIEKLLRAVLGHLGPNARKARGVVLQDWVYQPDGTSTLLRLPTNPHRDNSVKAAPASTTGVAVATVAV